MPDEPVRRAEARRAIENGKLPRCEPDRTWGGPGAGEVCTVCGDRITTKQMEYEVEFARADGLGVDKYHLHLRCFAVSELERTKIPDGAASHPPKPEHPPKQKRERERT